MGDAAVDTDVPATDLGTDAKPANIKTQTPPANDEVAMQEPELAEPAAADAARQVDDHKSPKPDQSVVIAKVDSQPPEMSELVPEHTEEEDRKPSDPALQPDTKPDPQDAQPHNGDQLDDDDKPPDTGTFSNNADLDSLFNDDDPPTTSAADGGDPTASAAATTDFGLDPHATTAADDFDFDTFTTNLDSNGADNDNISALLPGLHDYANPNPVGSGQPDFDALFATDAPVGGDGQGVGVGGGVQQASVGEAHDSTFDDLMDFADFNAEDYAGGSGEGGAGGDHEFNFTFD
ncbi:hypothetical protein LTR65_010468 [Meristemomyces frigidus]